MREYSRSHGGTFSLQLHGAAALLALNHRRRLDEEEEDQIQVRKDKTGRIWYKEKDKEGQDSLVQEQNHGAP